MARRREEVLNTVLATCLGSRGIEADPETILKRGRARPDVIAKSRGLRCALEGKIEGTPQARTRVMEDARTRVEQGIAHLAIGVLYPRSMRSGDFAQLANNMNTASLAFVVLTDAGDGGWGSGGIDDILAELRRAYDVIVRDDVLHEAVDTLNIGLSEVASSLLNHGGTCDRLVDLLGVGGKSDAEVPI